MTLRPLSSFYSLKDSLVFFEFNFHCQSLQDVESLSSTVINSNSQIKDFLRRIKYNTVIKAPTITSNHLLPRCKTFVRGFDEILSGGFPLGLVSQISGESSVGKTQFSYLLCSAFQLPKLMGGLSADVIFLDTESSFYPERVAQIAKSTKERALTFLQKTKASQEEIDALTARNFLDHIHVKRIRNLEELERVLEDMSLKGGKVKLLLLDSITFHFRYHINETSDRTGRLFTILQRLNYLAWNSEISVVLTNQMVDSLDEGGKSIPALGPNWSSGPSLQIQLEFASSNRNIRRFNVVKSGDFLPNNCCLYQITPDGIREVILD